MNHPITIQMATSAVRRYEGLWVWRGRPLWLEGRPDEGGRVVAVCEDHGVCRDLIPAPYSARSRVNDYGGGALVPCGDEVVFSLGSDQSLQRYSRGGEIAPLYSSPDSRFADGVFDQKRSRIITVVESKLPGSDRREQYLGSISLSAPSPLQRVHSGSDFYSSPRLSPDGRSLCWVTWDLPHMPWEGSRLWIGSLSESGELREARIVAGGSAESIVTPTWFSDGQLYFASDRGGFWNLHRFNGVDVHTICPMNADCAAPPWLFGRRLFSELRPGVAIVAVVTKGVWELGTISLTTGRYESLHLPWTDVQYLAADAGRAWAIVGSGLCPQSVIEIDTEARGSRMISMSSPESATPREIQSPELYCCRNTRGNDVYSFLYRSKQEAPVLVLVHGGPTSQATNSLNLVTQCWVSRGFTVVDVNYGGSTGFGRSYWERLRGEWGVSDREDIRATVDSLRREGIVAPDRALIRGGSAGGFVALLSLALDGIFQGGMVLYPVTDLMDLLRHSERFESGYFEWLLGSDQDRYREISPMRHLQKLSVPLLVMHGSDDRIVPIAQSEALVQELARRGVPHRFERFEGEGHGFRSAAAQRRALQLMVEFAESIAPLDQLSQ